jgi:hypothetical protein
MRSIITAHPYFQALPRGIKMMLLATESHFFNEVSSPGNAAQTKVPKTTPGLRADVTNPIQSSGYGS